MEVYRATEICDDRIFTSMEICLQLILSENLVSKLNVCCDPIFVNNNKINQKPTLYLFI